MNYESGNGCYPPGGSMITVMDIVGAGPEPVLSHSYLLSITQYIEGTNVWNALNTSLHVNQCQNSTIKGLGSRGCGARAIRWFPIRSMRRPSAISAAGVPDRRSTCVIRHTPAPRVSGRA